MRNNLLVMSLFDMLIASSSAKLMVTNKSILFIFPWDDKRNMDGLID